LGDAEWGRWSSVPNESAPTSSVVKESMNTLQHRRELLVPVSVGTVLSIGLMLGFLAAAGLSLAKIHSAIAPILFVLCLVWAAPAANWARIFGQLWTSRMTLTGETLGLAVRGISPKQALLWAIVCSSLAAMAELLGRWWRLATGVGWATASFYVIPILSVESVSARAAFTRSTELVPESWRRAVNPVLILGGIEVLVLAPLALGLINSYGNYLPVVPVWVVAVVISVPMIIWTTTLRLVVRAELYRNATA